MSHISGILVWTEAVFDRFTECEEGLILELLDGTHRIMKFENWEDSYATTKLKLELLKNGSPIRYATWNGYREDCWFCDVELV